FLHLGPELFKLMAGVDILHVPFRGAGPALIDVIGGHTHMAFASGPSVIAHVRSGKLRAPGLRRPQPPSPPPPPPTTPAPPPLPALTDVRGVGSPGPPRCHGRGRGGPRRHAATDHRQAAPGDFGDPGFSRSAEAVRQ